METDVIAFMRVEEGWVVERWGVADRLGKARQLGLLPRPQGAA
jgi:hypothetical protein